MTATAEPIILCRARIAENCLHGRPTRLQFGEPLPMDEDGTFDGERIVCDACYMPIIAASPSGQGTHAEIAALLPRLQREGVRFRHDLPDPDRAELISGAPAFAARLHDQADETISAARFEDGHLVPDGPATPLHANPKLIVIYGFHAMSRYREDHQLERNAFLEGRALTGWWFSTVCPEGEPGFQPIPTLVPLHRADFFHAARHGWTNASILAATGAPIH